VWPAAEVTRNTASQRQQQQHGDSRPSQGDPAAGTGSYGCGKLTQAPSKAIACFHQNIKQWEYWFVAAQSAAMIIVASQITCILSYQLQVVMDTSGGYASATFAVTQHSS
jgi:hypothetical protein